MNNQTSSILRVACTGFCVSALVTYNTLLVSRLDTAAPAVSFTIALTWAFAVGEVAKTGTLGKLAYAAASTLGCWLTILIGRHL
jgi:hypothetical protein